jgi:hypothetical protein
LQALYYNTGFRRAVLDCKPLSKKEKDPLYYLRPIFEKISSHAKKVAAMSTRKFMSFVQNKNGESPPS